MSPALSAALEALASHGVIGIVAVIALYGLASKDRELKVEREARLDDRRKCSEEITALHEKYQEELGEERHARLADEKLHTTYVGATAERLFGAIDTTNKMFEQASKMHSNRR